jgi:hypothetical protein
MKLEYTITRHRGLGDAASFSRHYRAPSAKAALRQAVYDMLAANGLLDRPIAHRLIAEAESCEVSPPSPGYLRSQRIRLDEFNSVEFWAHRV